MTPHWKNISFLEAASSPSTADPTWTAYASHAQAYVYVPVGTPGASCPSGYLPVVNEAECKNEVMGALTAGGRVIKNEFDTWNSADRVAGCYLNGGKSDTYNGHPGNGRVTFNRDLDSTSSTPASGRHICKDGARSALERLRLASGRRSY